MKVKIAVIFLGKPEGAAGWPYAQVNCAARAECLLRPVKAALPEIEFRDFIVDTLEKGEEVRAITAQEDLDGILIWPLVSYHHSFSMKPFVTSGCPTILANDLYGGDLLFLEGWDAAKREQATVVPVSSSHMDDLIHALRLIGVISSLKGRKILVVEKSHRADDQSHFWRRSYEEYLSAVKENLGIEVVVVRPQELLQYYQDTDPVRAKKIATQWVTNALAADEPNRSEIDKAARLYLAMSHLLDREGADGITIDCLNLFYTGKLPAYPCLGFFQLNNDGGLGVCEADLEAAITQLIGQTLTERPGFISDPVIDTASSQIIYAHCVSHNRPLGKCGPQVPYKIRTHAEDRKGASVQVFLPAGYPLTTVKLNILARKMAIHSAESVGNVEEERACRTKLAARARVDRILKNWDFQTFGWHRVTFYGDFRKDFLDLATLLGVEAVEEDR